MFFNQKRIRNILQSPGLTDAIMDIIADPRNVWGPRFVDVVVKLSSGDIVYHRYGDVDQMAESGWEDFREIATVKAVMSARTGLTTRRMISHDILEFEIGDYLYAGGVPLCKNGGVGASGLTEDADDQVSRQIAETILQVAGSEVIERLKSRDLSRRRLEDPRVG